MTDVERTIVFFVGAGIITITMLLSNQIRDIKEQLIINAQIDELQTDILEELIEPIDWLEPWEKEALGIPKDSIAGMHPGTKEE